MTAKEKAKELLEKCKMVFEDERGSLWNEISIHTWSKQCALIAVDEIINEIQFMAESDEGLPYWQEVRKEILSL